jgi:methyltransferase (TIGR00027 family)
MWRALHREIDSPPAIIDDPIGLQLLAPAPGWRDRPDMHPSGTSGFRAGIVARARFIEDFVLAQLNQGVCQYVILGAGLDTFAQRNPEAMLNMTVFEVGQPATQQWKRRRLLDLGLGIPANLKFVPVDFEASERWQDKLMENGFAPNRPAVIASAGVSLYLTREANAATLSQVAAFAPGSSLVMTFYLPLELIDPADRPMQIMVQERARAAGTPFVSFFSPAEIISLALEKGFKTARHFSRTQIIQQYFSKRTDGLMPASGEEFLVATTIQ